MTASALPEIRVGIIGAGLIGQIHAYCYRRIAFLRHPVPATVRLVVMSDSYEPLAREAADRFGFERTAASWEAVAEAGDVDAAIVALPNREHYQAVEALLASGKHVFCEKPLGIDAAQSWAMLQAARRAGVVHATGFNLRRMPAIGAIKNALDQGDLGEPRQFIGTYLTDYAADERLPLNWRFVQELAGGGALSDVGPHIIDASRFLLGDIESVHGVAMGTFIKERPIPAGHVTGHETASVTGEMGVVDNDDLASFSVRFRNGAVGTFAVSRIATGHEVGPAFELIGASGSATFDSQNMAQFEIFRTADAGGDFRGPRRVKVAHPHPYFEEIQVYPFAGFGHGLTDTWVGGAYEFANSIARGVSMPGGGFEDGYAVDLVLEAVRLSAEREASVRIDEVSSRVEAGR